MSAPVRLILSPPIVEVLENLSTVRYHRIQLYGQSRAKSKIRFYQIADAIYVVGFLSFPISVRSFSQFRPANRDIAGLQVQDALIFEVTIKF